MRIFRRIFTLGRVCCLIYLSVVFLFSTYFSWLASSAATSATFVFVGGVEGTSSATWFRWLQSLEDIVWELVGCYTQARSK